MNSKNCWTACLLWCALVCGGCAASSAANSDAPGARSAAGQHLRPDCLAAAGVEDATAYRIRPGDKLDVSFYLNSEFNTAVVVRPDGRIEMNLIGEFPPPAKTPSQLGDRSWTGFIQRSCSTRAPPCGSRTRRAAWSTSKARSVIRDRCRWLRA